MKLIDVVQFIVYKRTTRLHVKETLGRCLGCYFNGFVKQAHGFSGIVLTHFYPYKVHVDRRHTLLIAGFLHTSNDLPETLLGILQITAILIDVTHHIVGHIHLLVEFALKEFL